MNIPSRARRPDSLLCFFVLWNCINIKVTTTMELGCYELERLYPFYAGMNSNDGQASMVERCSCIQNLITAPLQLSIDILQAFQGGIFFSFISMHFYVDKSCGK